jgi:endogenous inhibitor of DNA gyrase (YacG/DUF329 family)
MQWSVILLIELTCEQCGKSFKRFLSNIGKHSFCTTMCSIAWQKVNNPKGKDHVMYNSVEIHCKHCGKAITLSKSKIRNNNYCSKKCAAVDRPISSPKKSKKKIVYCAWCNKALNLIPSSVKNYNFCSYDCRGLWYSQNYSGVNSPQYVDGMSPIRSRGNMWRTISPKVKQRDGGKCIRCGSEKYIVTHHIIPVSKTANNGGAINTHANLVTLCASCHGLIPATSDILPQDETWDKVRGYMQYIKRFYGERDVISYRKEEDNASHRE